MAAELLPLLQELCAAAVHHAAGDPDQLLEAGRDVARAVALSLDDLAAAEVALAGADGSEAFWRAATGAGVSAVLVARCVARPSRSAPCARAPPFRPASMISHTRRPSPNKSLSPRAGC
jgi:hypothetical protein